MKGRQPHEAPDPACPGNKLHPTDKLQVMKRAEESEVDYNILRFRNISISDIPILEKFFNRFPSRSCDFSVGGVMIWRNYFDYKIALYGDTLFIKGYDNDSGNALYYSPVGNLDRKKCLRLINEDAAIHGIPAVLLLNEETDGINDIADDMCASEFIDEWKEYLYPASAFLNFSGKKMEKKRNHLNYFTNNYTNTTITPLLEGDISDLLAFTVKFKENHPDNYLFNYESDSTMDVLREFTRYPFIGIVIRDAGKVIGYSFGEKTGDTFMAHVEKGDTAYRGIYQALASAMARSATQKYPRIELINREDDMGNEYLRKSKESYHPSLYIRKRAVSIPATLKNCIGPIRICQSQDC